MATADCVFCRIIAGELEASVVHENERTLAFLAIRPRDELDATALSVRSAWT